MMTAQAFADCEKPIIEGAVGHTACKDWPAHPGLTITAVSQIEPGPETGGSERDGTYDLSLEVVSRDDPKPLATYRQASAFVSDAIAFEDLELDTARYNLTPELRAFGVRVRFKGSSSANPLDESWLSLYVKEGDKLRPVLDRLIVYSYGGEWDTRCAGERSNTLRTIEIGKTSSHGYADLIVKSVTTGMVGEGEGEDCNVKTTTAKPVLTTLRYNGKTYVLPDGFKGV